MTQASDTEYEPSGADLPLPAEADFDEPGPVRERPAAAGLAAAEAMFSTEAEEAVLGCVLINPDAFFEVAHFLKPDDFYLHKHRWIWDAFVRLHDQRLPVDTLTVGEELERHRQLNEVGGTAYLARLIATVPTSLHAEAYGRIVEREAMRRRLMEAASAIAKLALTEDREINEVVNDAEAAVFAVSERRLTKDITPLKEALSGYYDRIKYLFEHQGELAGVPTGFYDLDKLLGGLQKSDLIIIAGRPGSGKTGFMLNVAKNASQTHHKHVAVFSLEMSNEQLVQRLISQETGIDSHRLRQGDLSDDEWPLFVHAANVLGEAQIFLDDTPAISPTQVRAKCRRLDQEFGLDLVIVDYLQLMQAEGRSENRVQEVSRISRNLKALARELNVPVLAGAQLSRAVEQRENKRPVLSDLRESGCLTGDSLVTLADTGARVSLASLVGQSGFRVWALNEETFKLEPALVSSAFATGRKPIFRMRTRLGRTIRATANHKFRAFSGWRRLDELAAGDRIGLPRRIACAAAATMSQAEAALLGHLIGDGCTLPRHAIQYTTRELDLAQHVVELAVQIFGDRVQPRIQRERQWYQVYLASTQRLTHGRHNPITEWLSQLGIFGQRAHQKRVPALLFEQPPSVIAAFLRHLWATDGCIRASAQPRRYPAVYFASSSEGLARDVQSLLLRLGINAVLTCHDQGEKGRTQHHVSVMGHGDLNLFADRVGAVGEYKSAALAQCLGWLEGRVANTNRDIIPREIWRSLAVPSMLKNSVTSRQMQAALGSAYAGTGLYKQNVSRDRAARLAAAVGGDDRIAALAQSDVYWDEITSIEPEGEQEVYDLTVPGLSNFVADDIIVHNSIEQDSDIVMFIHRPDMYQKEGDRTNVADIIVAKHRNGPTADIQLVFRSALTKFENAETRYVDLAAH